MTVPYPEQALADIGAKILSQPIYIMLFAGNYVPDGTETAATIAALATEFTGYSDANRPAANLSYSAGGLISNDGSEPEFTITQPVTLYGHCLVTSNIKNGTSGLLYQVRRWSAPRTLSVGDKVRVPAGIPLIPTNL